MAASNLTTLILGKPCWFILPVFGAHSSPVTEKLLMKEKAERKGQWIWKDTLQTRATAPCVCVCVWESVRERIRALNNQAQQTLSSKLLRTNMTRPQVQV